MCYSQRSQSWILQLFNYPYEILTPTFEDMKFQPNLTCDGVRDLFKNASSSESVSLQVPQLPLNR
jgi:hypothetical protein